MGPLPRRAAWGIVPKLDSHDASPPARERRYAVSLMRAIGRHVAACHACDDRVGTASYFVLQLGALKVFGV